MNFFPGGAACVRRTLFERLGPYDESMFVGLEDYELAIRAMRGDRPIRARGVPEVGLRHDRRRAETDADVRAAQTRYPWRMSTRRTRSCSRSTACATTPTGKGG